MASRIRLSSAARLSAVTSAAAVGVGGKGGVAGDRRVHGGAANIAEVLLEHGASTRALEGVCHACEVFVSADLDGRPAGWRGGPRLAGPPGYCREPLVHRGPQGRAEQRVPQPGCGLLEDQVV